MRLIYKTRDNSSPQGKPRVYYTGHPADLSVYSPNIFQDILGLQNCAIYYDAEPEAPYDREELFRQLEQMQLIVIPVTSRFLQEPNRAREVEFDFALKQCHIPILPLIQEPGLETMFNEKCGALQILGQERILDQEKALAGTVLSYKEKLDKYLSSVLIGDELAAKIRAAFDAYIFLSYRKKDRKYAQELMPLIHQNDFCRDIAIWYDEFLVPGENFNQAIADAMERCQLFTLAVTPNIMEPGNYVMTTEYPEAKKTGKPILPVELVPTDHKALETSFQDIPPSTDGYDQKALSAALLNAVQKLAIRENDHDPQHNFFMGLAYLNGIDVEVDRARAKALITGAAEAGLPEAMKTLVDLYSSGNSVEQDNREAALWQGKLTEVYRTRFQESQTETDGTVLMTALLDLGYFQHMSNSPYMMIVRGLSRQYGAEEYQWEAADLAAARRSCLEAIDVGRQVYDRYGTRKARELALWGYGQLGDICLDWRKPDQAKTYYIEMKELCQELGAWSTLAGCCHKIGEACWQMGNYEEAKEHHMAALDLRQRLCRKTDDAREWSAIIDTYTRLGHECWELGRFDEAREYHLQELDLYTWLCTQTWCCPAWSDPKNVWWNWRWLHSMCRSLGHDSWSQGRQEEALDYYRRSLDASERAWKMGITKDSAEECFAACIQMAQALMESGDLQLAGEYVQKAFFVYEKRPEELAEDKSMWKKFTSAFEALRQSAVSRLSQGENHGLKDLWLRFQEAEATGSERERAVCCDRLGDAFLGENIILLAKSYYLQAFDHFQFLEHSARNWAEDYKIFSELGILPESEGDDFQEDAKPDLYQADMDLAVCSGKLGRICRLEYLEEFQKHQKDFDDVQAWKWLEEAEEYYRSALKLFQELWKATEDPEALRGLAVCYERVGEIVRDQADIFDLECWDVYGAKYYYRQALYLYGRLCQQTQAIPARRDLARCYRSLGSICREDGSLAEAEEYYARGLRLAKFIYKLTQTPQDQGLLAGLQEDLHKMERES